MLLSTKTYPVQDNTAINYQYSYKVMYMHKHFYVTSSDAPTNMFETILPLNFVPNRTICNKWPSKCIWNTLSCEICSQMSRIQSITLYCIYSDWLVLYILRLIGTVGLYTQIALHYIYIQIALYCIYSNCLMLYILKLPYTACTQINYPVLPYILKLPYTVYTPI